MVCNTSFDVNYDPDDEDISDWLASKFNNHKTMDSATKNALWIYWMRGEDKEVLTDEELLSEELYVDSTFDDGVEELFSIDVDVFNYETPLCREFKEFNYLLQIDVGALTSDYPRFKTDEDFKNAWYYEWNNQVPWWMKSLGFYMELWKDQLKI